jgi:hypothetical protein
MDSNLFGAFPVKLRKRNDGKPAQGVFAEDL